MRQTIAEMQRKLDASPSKPLVDWVDSKTGKVAKLVFVAATLAAGVYLGPMLGAMLLTGKAGATVASLLMGAGSYFPTYLNATAIANILGGMGAGAGVGGILSALNAGFKGNRVGRAFGRGLLMGGLIGGVGGYFNAGIKSGLSTVGEWGKTAIEKLNPKNWFSGFMSGGSPLPTKIPAVPGCQLSTALSSVPALPLG